MFFGIKEKSIMLTNTIQSPQIYPCDSRHGHKYKS